MRGIKAGISSRAPVSLFGRAALAASLIVSVIGALLVTTALPAAAATPTWPSSQYMGVLQNVGFTIPIAVTGGTPLTAMTVNTAPSNVSGFALQNINLTTGTADMVGTYTAAPSGSTVTASIKATNSSGNANGSFALEAYTCSWASSVGTTAVFDSKQSEYLTGTQSTFGGAVTSGLSMTTGTGTVTPTCADLDVPGFGASTETLSNPFSGTITPTNNDNSSAESDMWAGCGTVSILGTKTGTGCGARTIPANT